MLKMTKFNKSISKKWDFNLIMITLIASLGFLSIGTFISWTSIFYRHHFMHEIFSLQDISYIASALAFGAIFGPIITISFGTIFGRKIWFIISCSLMICSLPAILIYPENFWIFIISRIISGIAIGILHFLIPVYILEFSTIKLNQTLQNLLYIQFAVGILIEYIAGIYFELMISTIILMIAPILFLIGIYFLPESPNYLLSIGENIIAKNILNKYCDNLSTISTNTESTITTVTTENSPITVNTCCKNDINDFEYDLKLNNERIKIHLNRYNLKTIFKSMRSSVMFPIIGSIVLEQMAGGFSIFFYLLNIVTNLKSENPELFTIILCVILMLSVPLFIIFKSTRYDKNILQLSILIMFNALIGLGSYRHIQSILGKPSEYCYIPIICGSIFILFYGVGPLRLTYHFVQQQTNEMNCLVIRCISVSLTWFTICICTKVLPRLIIMIGVGWLVWYMAIIWLIKLAFVTIFVPDLRKSSSKMKLLESGDTTNSSEDDEISNES